EPKVGAVTQENVYSQQALYDEKSPLGAFQQLHLVGFHQISTHEQVNGNVITDLLDYHAPIEAQLSYVRQIQAETDVVLTKNTPDAIAVLGKNIEVQNRDQGTGISVMTTNGQRVQVLQPDQSLNPETILQDGEIEFQDLAELKTLAINFNQLVSQYARTKGIETITEGEQLTITFDAETQVQVENFTAESLANVKTIVIKGMPKTHEQTYFLNLDLQGQKAFNFPKVVIEYPNGEQVAIEETAELSNNLIWNLFDSKVENTLTNATVTMNDELTGNLLAPLATFDLQASVKGFVIAEAIQVFAPTYSASFTGETINRAVDEPETTPEVTTPEVSDPTPEAEVPETETPEITPEVEGTIPETEPVQPLVETYDLNGLTVTKSIDKTNLTVGEEATVTLTVSGTQSSSSLPAMTNNEEIILVIDISQSTGAKWDEYKTQLKTFIANLFAANPNTNNGGKVTIKAIAFNGPGTGQDQNRNTQDSRLIFDQTKTLAEINTILDGIQPGKSVSNGSDKASTNISGLFYVNAGATPLKTIVDAGITRNATKRIIIASDWITNTTTTMTHVTDDTIFNREAANDAKNQFGNFVQNQIFNNGKIPDKSKVKIYPIQLYSNTNSTVNKFITDFATTGNAKIANLVQAQKNVSAADGLTTALNEIVTSIAGTTSTATPKLTITDYLDLTKFDYVANSATITGVSEIKTTNSSANNIQTIQYSNITKGTSDVVVTYKIKAKIVGTQMSLSPTTSTPNVADGTNTQKFNPIQVTVAATPTPEVNLDLTAVVNKTEITQGEAIEITLGLSASDQVSGTITDFIDTAKFEFIPGTYTAVSGTTEVGSVTINASAKSIQWEIKQEAKNIEATYKIKAKSGAVPGETLTNPSETPGTVVIGATVANFPNTPVTIAAALPTGNLTLNKTATANSDDTYSIMLEAKGTPEQTAPKTA
ncbi:MAG: vWA domain-containing protein, partial [Culicoidibacterales bacterium]